MATFSGEPPMRASSAMPLALSPAANTSIKASPLTTITVMPLSVQPRSGPAASIANQAPRSHRENH